MAATVFGMMQWAIHEIDNKFDVVIQVEPTDLALLAGAMDHISTAEHPEVVLPCDMQGRLR